MIRRPLRDPTASGLLGKGIPNDAQLPLLSGFGVHIGLFIALLLVPIVGYVMTRTPFGFRVRMLGLDAGSSPDNWRQLGPVDYRADGDLGRARRARGGDPACRIRSFNPPRCPRTATGLPRSLWHCWGGSVQPGCCCWCLFLGALNAGGQAMSINHNVPYAVVVLAIQGVFVIFLLVADRLARGR